MKLLAPCPVTIIKDSSPRRKEEDEAEGGKNRANASLIIRSPRLEANGPAGGEGEGKCERKREGGTDRRG